MKKKVAALVLFCAFLSGIVCYNLGYYSKGTKNKGVELAEQDQEYKDTKSKLEYLKGTIEKYEEYEKNKADYDVKISESKETIESLVEEISKLDAQVKSKQDELNTLNGQILTAKGNPITLPAGQYTVGTDIPEGRYKVTGSSNFVVKSSTGSLLVNAILGNSFIGDGDYVCTLNVGDKVDAGSQNTYTPIS